MSTARAGGPFVAHQSLGRSLTPPERELAAALETIFASGVHDFAAVVQALQAAGTRRPSGSAGDWSLEALGFELSRINAELDLAYAAGLRPDP